jgi:hypothetical protein
VHLVGFTIEIYYDARPYKSQTRLESTVSHLKAPNTLTPYCCTVPIPLYGVDKELLGIWCSGHNWDLKLE